MQIPDHTEDSVKQALAESKVLPIFPVLSLGQYCEVTDFIRRAWVDKVNDRQNKPDQGSKKLKGYVGEILPWFRGVRESEEMLTPKLAREWIKYNQHKNEQKNKPASSDNLNLDRPDHKSIYDLEDYYFDRFTRFGRPFLGGFMPMDDIEWNYIMRHHEVPSRLLDWTKGSLIALSYAVRHSLPTRGELNSNDPEYNHKLEDAVVWMLEPRRLMEMTTQFLDDVNSTGIRNIASREKQVRGMRRDFFKDPSKFPGDAKPDDQYHNRHLWDSPLGYWDYPLPLIPSHISARVESHLSRFTLHSLSSFRQPAGQNTTKDSVDIPSPDDSLIQFAKKARVSDNIWYLAKIELSGTVLRSIARVLRMTGVGDMNFTQDLDGLARELQIRAHLGFQDDLNN
jgi:hypothetical protein